MARVRRRGVSPKVKVVPKAWGEERWIVNRPEYCGKQMLLRRGWRCSMHMHRRKDETFFVTRGRMLFELEGPRGRVARRVLGPGSVQHVPPGVYHRFSGITDTEFFEFSTHHEDSDSYRKTESGRVPAKRLSAAPGRSTRRRRSAPRRGRRPPRGS